MKKNIKTSHSRMSLSGIFNACRGCIDVKNIFNVEDPRLQASGMTEGEGSGMTSLCNHSQSAFTLIELLVVVLIIGILSAIALPQYQKAVEKSKAMQGLSIIKTLAQAGESYYLANGDYPDDLDTLDVSVPAGFTGTEKFYNPATTAHSNDEWSIQVEKTWTRVLFVGKISGPYKGAGFAYFWDFGEYTYLTKQVFCIETIADGVIFEKEPGAFCQKIFGGTFLFEGSHRVYSMP